MTTRDPNFWKRFSIAVHQDDLAKEEMAQRPDLKHSYVPFILSPSHSPLGSPTSQSPLSPSIPASKSTPFTPTTSSPLSPSSQRPQRPRTKLQKKPSTKPLLRPTIPSPPAPAALPPSSSPRTRFDTLPPSSPRLPWTSTHRHSHTNASILSLSLSGRPPSRFKFWTTITADPPRRDSWLIGQKRKARQRTWICWAFWLGLMALVAALVVTLLVLKGRKII